MALNFKEQRELVRDCFKKSPIFDDFMESVEALECVIEYRRKRISKNKMIARKEWGDLVEVGLISIDEYRQILAGKNIIP